LAAIPLLGGGLSLAIAIDQANDAKAMHEEQARLVCAQTALKSDVPPGHGAVVDLQKLGCSDLPQTTSYFKVLNAPAPEGFQLRNELPAASEHWRSLHADHRASRLWRGPRDRLGHWRVCGFVGPRYLEGKRNGRFLE
jgi:hypothetical protein